MTTRIMTLLTSLVLVATTVYGQAYEPIDLAKKIFGKEKFPGIDKFIIGEYKGEPNGQDLHKGTTTKFMLLGQTEKTAVVAMTILDSSGTGLDTYLHFEKDMVWKMSAFRALAMTGIIEQVKVELEKMTPQQIDDIIAKSRENGGKDNAMFSSKEEYNFELGNARLTLELDENIIKHFLANQNIFERLKNLALEQLANQQQDEERRTKLIENLKADYQKVLISSVSTGGYELGNCINFSIGGMLDNTVGYLYVKDKKYLPAMNPERVIMIREIGNGWYMYKTT